MKIEETGDIDFNDPKIIASIAISTYNNPPYKKILSKLLPELLYKGLLEI